MPRAGAALPPAPGPQRDLHPAHSDPPAVRTGQAPLRSVDIAAMDTTAAPASTSTVKPGWKTSEFWITVGFIVLSHVINLLRTQPGTAGTVATIAGDALAATGYAVSRGLAKQI